MKCARSSTSAPTGGNTIENRPAGSFRDGTASGAPRHMTCMYHSWQFDMKGNCAHISREKEGYQSRLSRDDVGLRRLRCEVRFGGFVWVTLDDSIGKSVEEWGAGCFDCLKDHIGAEPLEVFHYHKAIIPCNYKLWHDTNSEFYHDYLHYHNRITGFNDAYFARQNTGFENGHVTRRFVRGAVRQVRGVSSRANRSPSPGCRRTTGT